MPFPTPAYSVAILALSAANLVLAAIAYLQRAKQIRGHATRERQVALAEARNDLAERRLRRLDDQLALLGEIRDALCPDRRPATVGVLDVGAGTVKLVVCRYDRRRGVFDQVCKRRAYLALGAEVERHGEYTGATLGRLDEGLRELTDAAAEAGCDRLAVVVTAPGRSGRNPHELLRVVHRATGHAPYVLSPEDEARLAFAGATMAPAAHGGSAVVCDVGGGSTEVALGSPGDGVTASASFAIGALMLAERHFRHDPPTASELAAARADAKRALRLDELEPGACIALATGGSARAVARLAGRVVGAEELEVALARATAGGAVASPHRRRSLPAGIVILDVLQSAIELPLTIATGGLREGVMLRLLNAGSGGLPARRLAA